MEGEPRVSIAIVVFREEGASVWGMMKGFLSESENSSG